MLSHMFIRRWILRQAMRRNLNPANDKEAANDQAKRADKLATAGTAAGTAGSRQLARVDAKYSAQRL
jgi:hypothetical protein